MRTTGVPGNDGDQKRELDLLELELQMVVSAERTGVAAEASPHSGSEGLL